jgi:murein DD-endopeptidase MepM/ murein hydrolase activator NlpD
MGSAGDDGIVDPQPHRDTGDDGSFDPGLETGYLRRAPRDRELEPELGAAPFDPGPGHYDERRASKEAKRREREVRRRRQSELKAREIQEVSQPTTAALTSGSAALQPPPEPDPAPAPLPKPKTLPEPAPVTELRPRRESLADRLERERVERERAESARRAKIQRERTERERTERDRREQRRRERAEKLRRERQSVRPARPKAAPAKPVAARIDPGVKGPVRKRVRAAENRQRVATRRRGLFWPTAKAALAVTVALGLGAALGSVLGLPVPGIEQTTGNASLANSASIFGIDPGTPAGLTRGYVFPILGPHNFGDRLAGFGAPRSGHIHEGQDIFGKTGTAEVAVHDGIVVDRGKNSDPDDGGRGNYVVIYSPSDNHSFVYMHMLKPAPVMLGDQVHAGDPVGQLGCTGSCEGPHLHFEVRIGKATLGADTRPINPLPFLEHWPQSTPG